MIERDGDGLDTVVVHGGPLGEHKGINAPGVPLPPSAVTDEGRRRSALRPRAWASTWSRSASCRRPTTCARAREIIDRAGARDVPLIAKIERPAGVGNLDAILALTRTA